MQRALYVGSCNFGLACVNSQHVFCRQQHTCCTMLSRLHQVNSLAYDIHSHSQK